MVHKALASLVLVSVVVATSAIRSQKTDVSDLVAVVQVHRHGQRTPVSFYTNDPYSDDSYWPVDSGQLTNTGKNQHFALGQFTRDRYDGFLSADYDPEEFYAQTTNVDRTHMSGQCNIAGIFRPKGDEVWNRAIDWQPIPLHAADETVLTTGPSCAIYYAEAANVLVNADEYKLINERYAELYAYLTENSGDNVTSVSGVSGIWDALIIEDQFGYELPEWTRSVYPNPMTELSGWAFKTYSYTDLQKKLAAGNFLYWLSNYFSEMFSDPSSNEKVQLFSGHDTNVAAILNTLGAYRTIAPPSFASTVYFELRNKSGVATVNVWHMDKETWERVNVLDSGYDLTLDEFDEVLGDYLVNSTVWEELCDSSVSEITDLSTVQESPEVLRELANVLAHANGRRHKKDQLVIDLSN